MANTPLDISNTPPTPQEFVALRIQAGMHPREQSSAQKGIPHSLFWVIPIPENKCIFECVKALRFVDRKGG